MDVVKAYVHTIVAPAIDYWIKTIVIKKGDEVARFKADRIFNPLHVVVNKISVGVCVRCGYEDRIHFGRILEEL